MARQYTICYIATGGITLEADNEDEAIRKFEDIDYAVIKEQLIYNGYDITDIIDEGEVL